MNGDWLEQGLNDRFSQMDPGLNLEAEWAALDSRRKKRRKAFWLFWIGIGSRGAILALTVLAIYTIQQATRGIDPLSTSGIEVPVQAGMSPSSIANQDCDELEEGVAFEEPFEIAEVHSGIRLQPSVGSNGGLQPTYIPQEPMFASEGQSVDISLPAVAKLPVTIPLLGGEDLVPTESRSFIGATEPVTSIRIIPSNQGEPTLLAGAIKVEPDPASRWTLGLESAYGPAFVDAEENLNENFNGYFDLRATDRLTYGLSLRFALQQRFRIRSGLYRFQHMQHLTGVWNRQTKRMAENQLIEIRQLADGSIEEIYGSTAVQVNETISYSLWESHQAWIVPLEIGYVVLNRQPLEVSVNGGVGLSFGYIRKGQRPFTNKAEPFFYPIRESFSLNMVYWQWRFSTDLRYSFNQVFSVGAALTAGGDLNRQISYPTAFENDRFSWLQLRLGLYFSL